MYKDDLKIALDTAVSEEALEEVRVAFLGRKGKLNGSAKELFSGDFWTGEKAVQLGLADGTGNLWDVMQKQFDVHYYVDYTTRPSFFQSLLSGVETSISKNLVPHADLQARMGV